MKKTLKIFTLLMLVLLIAATVMSTACAPTVSYNPTEANITSRTELGSGAKTVTFLAVGKTNEAALFTIHTDAKYLAEALLAHGLIAGEETSYSFTVYTVNGEEANFNTDSAYWALWEGDTYANCGASSLEIKDGGCYSFVYTKSTWE